MKKMIMLGFVCSLTALFMISSAFAEPYKDKAFPEQQVIKQFCAKTVKKGSKCSYIGKVKGNERYTVHFTVPSDYAEYEVSEGSIWQLDSGIWLMRIGGNTSIIMQ